MRSTPYSYLLCGAMLVALGAVFLWVPTEREMGIIQRIFYFHVPSAMSAFLAFFLVFLGSTSLYEWTHTPFLHHGEAVKAGWLNLPFFISRNEHEFAARNVDQFCLFRVFNFRKQPKAFELNGSLEQFLRLSTETYRADFQA